jgi:hypothetical protein
MPKDTKGYGSNKEKGVQYSKNYLKVTYIASEVAVVSSYI